MLINTNMVRKIDEGSIGIKSVMKKYSAVRDDISNNEILMPSARRTVTINGKYTKESIEPIRYFAVKLSPLGVNSQ